MSTATSYGFDENTSEVGGSKFIDVTPETAIAEGRFVKEIKFVEAEGDKNAYFEVVVEDKFGKTANKRWYEPNVDGTYVKNEADLKKAVEKFNKVIANLSRRFLGESYKPQGVTDFKSLCNIVIRDIGEKYANKELRIKVILNKDDFPTLPAYAPIFEDITVPANQTKLQITKYDNVVSANIKPDADPTGNDFIPEGTIEAPQF